MTPEQVAAQVQKTLATNTECLVAQYFKRHPDTKPENIEIRYASFVDENKTLVNRIWIEKKKK